MIEKSVLAIEDSPEMQLLLKSSLQDICLIHVSNCTNDAWSELSKSKPDLIISDIELPGESGFQFCAKLKSLEKYSRIPILFLTSHTENANEILGFSLGAEDFIRKPIERNAFQARIRAKLKSSEFHSNKSDILRMGQLVLNLSEFKAYLESHSKRVDLFLSATEFKILKLLLTRPGHVFVREVILEQVWGKNLIVTDRTIDTHIYNLRKKLGPSGNLILTVSGLGYSFKPQQIETYNKQEVLI